jgi:cytochrome c553
MIPKLRFWRRRVQSGCFGALLAVVILFAGCSSSDNSLPIKGVFSGPATSLAADAQVKAARATSCSDCHSDHARGPWNAKIAPSYLFAANKARAALNFSDWGELKVKQRRATASRIATEVARGSMPPGDYEFLHPAARLSAKQKRLVLQWASRQMALAAH